MITAIVIHCSDSPHGRGDNAETIHRWHQQRGWSGIGYHYVITESGVVQAGRPHYWTGAHVSGHNRGSLGICLIGRDTFTTPQMHSLHSTLRQLHRRYPAARICGHRDLDSAKACPGFNVQDVIDQERFQRAPLNVGQQ